MKAVILGLFLFAALVLSIEARPVRGRDRQISGKQEGKRLEKLMEKYPEFAEIFTEKCGDVCPPSPRNKTSALDCASCIIEETGSPLLSDFLTAVAQSRSERNCSTRKVGTRRQDDSRSESLYESSASESKQSASDSDDELTAEFDRSDSNSEDSDSKRSASNSEDESEQSNSESEDSVSEASEDSETTDGADDVIAKRETEEGDELIQIFSALIGRCSSRCENLGRSCGKPVLPCVECIVQEVDFGDESSMVVDMLEALEAE